MQTVFIKRLTNLTKAQASALRKGQMEAAKVWNRCRDAHQEARKTKGLWPGRTELQKLTKGSAELHSQSTQAVVHAFLGNVDATTELRKRYPKNKDKHRYPWRDKTFYPIAWPAQAMDYVDGVLLLKFGKGRPTLRLAVALTEPPGACKIVWKDGFELHICREVPATSQPPGDQRATVDLGQIHQAAVSTTTGQALLISGRGIRSQKRLRNKCLGKISGKLARC